MNWPNLETDRKAWEMAKAALGSNVSINQLAARAQTIKEALNAAATRKGI